MREVPVRLSADNIAHAFIWTPVRGAHISDVNDTQVSPVCISQSTRSITTLAALLPSSIFLTALSVELKSEGLVVTLRLRTALGRLFIFKFRTNGSAYSGFSITPVENASVQWIPTPKNLSGYISLNLSIAAAPAGQ